MGASASLSLLSHESALPHDASDVTSRAEARSEVSRMRHLLRANAAGRAPLPDRAYIEAAHAMAFEHGAVPSSLAEQWAVQKKRGGKAARRTLKVTTTACDAASAAVHAAEDWAFDAKEVADDAVDAAPAYAKGVARDAAAAAEAAAAAAAADAQFVAPSRVLVLKGAALFIARCASAAAAASALAAGAALEARLTRDATAEAEEAELEVAAEAEQADGGTPSDSSVEEEGGATAAKVSVAPALATAAASATEASAAASFARACATGDVDSVARILAADATAATVRPPSPHRYSGRASPRLGESQWRLESAIEGGHAIAPLCAAARGGHLEVVTLLLTLSGPAAAARRRPHASALHAACHQGHIEVAETLLHAGADVDGLATAFGITPLHLAAARNDAPLAELLLRFRATVDVPAASNGATPLLVAAGRGFDDVVELLLAHGAGTSIDRGVRTAARETPLWLAAAFGNTKCVRMLVLSGANIAFQTKDTGATPIYAAASRGHTAVVDVFLGAAPVCAEVDIATTTARGATPLWACAARNDIVTMERLLSADVDVNKPAADDGSTPLYAAAVRGHAAAVKMLIAYRADIDVKAKVAPIAFNAQSGSRAKKRGARLYDAAPLAALAPIDAARMEGHAEVVALLERAAFTRANPLDPEQGGSFLIWLSNSLLLDFQSAAPPVAPGTLSFAAFWHAELDGSIKMA